MLKTEAVLYIGLSQALFAAFTLATRSRVSIAQRILIACLLTIALKFSLFLLNTQGRFPIEYSHSLTPLTFGPFLYLYSVYLMEGRTKFRLMDLLHFLPFTIVSVGYLLFFRHVNFSEVHFLQSDEDLGVKIAFALVLLCSILAYIILIFTRLNGFRQQLKSEFSFSSGKVRLLWLNFIALLFSITFLVYYITGAINAINFREIFDVIGIAHFGLTILAFAVSYFGLRQPSLFRNLGRTVSEAITPPTNSNEGQSAPETQESRFSKKEASELTQRLNNHMESEKLYLNSELTLAYLSERINVTKYELTDLLNNHIGKNFFTYVNEFRIKAAARLLKDPEYDHLTIISIAYDCGFNSKSTFNNLFKQHFNSTPSEYRKAS